MPDEEKELSPKDCQAKVEKMKIFRKLIKKDRLDEMDIRTLLTEDTLNVYCGKTGQVLAAEDVRFLTERYSGPLPAHAALASYQTPTPPDS